MTIIERRLAELERGYRAQSIPYTYVFDKTLAASTAYAGLAKATDNDGDFIWMGLSLSYDSNALTVRFKDSNGIYISSNPVLANGYQGSGSDPFCFSDPIWYPAGSQIGFDLVNNSGSENVLEIQFHGRKIIKTYRETCR